MKEQCSWGREVNSGTWPRWHHPLVKNFPKATCRQLRHQVFTHSPQSRSAKWSEAYFSGIKDRKSKEGPVKGTLARSQLMKHSKRLQVISRVSPQCHVPQPGTELEQWSEHWPWFCSHSSTRMTLHQPREGPREVCRHCTWQQSRERCGWHGHSLLLHQTSPPATKPHNKKHLGAGGGAWAIPKFDIQALSQPLVSNELFMCCTMRPCVWTPHATETQPNKQATLELDDYTALTASTTERWQRSCPHWQDALVTYYQGKRSLSKWSVANVFLTWEVQHCESFLGLRTSCSACGWQGEALVCCAVNCCNIAATGATQARLSWL